MADIANPDRLAMAALPSRVVRSDIENSVH
jgi:hypothetical protein